jgi:hypothetical protein
LRIRLAGDGINLDFTLAGRYECSQQVGFREDSAKHQAVWTV